MRLFLDTETYCELPISVGTYRYAKHAEVMLVTYAIDDGVPQVWDRTAMETIPAELAFALESQSCEVVMHNSQFDRIILRDALGYDISVSRIWDTMAQALSHGLPGGLGALCQIFAVDADNAKHDGSSLIRRFCQPAPSNHKATRYTAQTHPEEWSKFVRYALNDISAMRVLMRRIPTWNYPRLRQERELFALDQKINDRGFLLDIELARAAVQSVLDQQGRLAGQLQSLTKGRVEKPSQRDAFLSFIGEEYGLWLSDLTNATVEKALHDPFVSEQAKDLLRIRSYASSTSTAKFKRMLETVSDDNRQRGVLMYCGASRTGRFSSRLIQVQNLKRSSRKGDDIERGIEAIKAGAADLFEPDVLDLASDALRGCIIASQHNKLVVADLSNIEGRVAAWLAEPWKVKAFEAFDAGQGEDLYKQAYAQSFRIKPQDVTPDQRQIGKVQELALQYQGGVGAFATFATNLGIDLEELGARAQSVIPADVFEEARAWSEQARRKGMPDFGLSERAWLVCDSLKRLWRRAHPGIAGIWTALQHAVIKANSEPNTIISVGKLQVTRQRNWLRIILPSGRSLSYAGLRVVDDNISYMGMNQITRQWERTNAYGGKFFEQVCQGLARDVMVSSMPAAEAAGYAIGLTVHDELVCETPDTPDFNAEDLARIMATRPKWAEGLPLAAAGFECTRYRK